MEPKILISLLLLSLSASLSSATQYAARVGINYGVLGNNLPSPKRSIELIQSLRAKRVKIYDANPEILTALKNTKMQVSIMVPNDLVPKLAANQSLANDWVHKNVAAFLPETAIRYVLVGNEILTSEDKSLWKALVPAMQNVHKALAVNKIFVVKVGTPLAMDVIGMSFPPSNGTFRYDVSESVVKPLLKFITSTKSYMFLDVYPYFSYANNPNTIPLDYALFQAAKDIVYVDPNTNLRYTNVLDQMLDSVIFAMEQIGFKNVPIYISETGWPSKGDPAQLGASLKNAADYNRNFVKRFTADPPVGTPARPGSIIPAFLFSLYNENLKPGAGSERNFGLLYPDGKSVFPINLSGRF